jgi:hypothetical protein
LCAGSGKTIFVIALTKASSDGAESNGLKRFSNPGLDIGFPLIPFTAQRPRKMARMQFYTVWQREDLSLKALVEVLRALLNVVGQIGAPDCAYKKRVAG